MARNGDDKQQLTDGLFEAQDNMAAMRAWLAGEVHQLVADGWTDAQARAIVATSFGWRPDSPPPGGA